MNLVKHLSLFDPARVDGDIAIAGVGALGSALTLQLGKLGCTSRLVLFDHDVVEDHNLANQVLYGPDDVGESKVQAAAWTLHALTGSEPRAIHRARLHAPEQLANVTHLFVCVDSMLARENIFAACVEHNYALRYFSEGRMNARNGMAFAFAPSVARNREYRARLYPDAEVKIELGTCGNVLSIGATATVLACQMTWALINHHAGTPRWEELSFAVDDLCVHQHGWMSDEHTWRRAG